MNGTEETRMRSPLRIAVLLSLFLASASVIAEESGRPRSYPARGIVKQVLPDKPGALVVDHEEIPGFMAAMTMTLTARNRSEVANLKAGDQITFQLQVTLDDGWIDQVKVVRAAKDAFEAKALPALPDLRPIQPGESLPDATLVDHLGQKLDLKNYRGQALALTFVYMSCSMPNFCPRLNANFQKTHHLLQADPTSPKNWQMLTITIDPEHDTTEVLALVAKSLQADPRRWRFATGTLKDITAFSLRCGLGFWDERGRIQHNLRTLVIDANGRVRRVFTESEWKPEDLISELRAAAGA